MFKANFRVITVKSQLVEHVLLENTVAVACIRLLAEGYILNYRCEAKSQATVKNYQYYRLKCFLWFCQVKGVKSARIDVKK